PRGAAAERGNGHGEECRLPDQPDHTRPLPCERGVRTPPRLFARARDDDRAGMPRAGGGLLRLPEHGLLERLGDREPYLLPGRDLDGLSGLRVAAHAGLHLAEPEDAQPRDLDGLALLDALHDRLGQEVEHLIGLLTVHATRFRKLRHQLRLRHRSPSIPGGSTVSPVLPRERSFTAVAWRVSRKPAPIKG